MIALILIAKVVIFVASLFVFWTGMDWAFDKLDKLRDKFDI